MITDISIDQRIEDDLALITFEFEFTRPLDTSTLIIKTWDEEKNPSTNYFHEAIKVIDQSSMTDDEIPSSVPLWIKNNTGWWASGEIDDGAFIQGIQFLIQQDILEIPLIEQSSDNHNESQGIPNWIKNNAGWWADDLISDSDFVIGLQYLIKNGIIQI